MYMVLEILCIREMSLNCCEPMKSMLFSFCFFYIFQKFFLFFQDRDECMDPYHVPIYIKKKLKDFVEEFRTLLRLVLSFFACQITKIDIYVNINPWDLFFSYAITGVINGDSFIFPVPFRNVAKV